MRLTAIRRALSLVMCAGILLVMKGVAPADTTMENIYKVALPFLRLTLIAMVLIVAFPTVALRLPGLMH